MFVQTDNASSNIKTGNKGFWYLISVMLVSIHSRKYFSFAATFPSRTLQGQANRLKIPLLFAHCLEIIKY